MPGTPNRNSFATENRAVEKPAQRGYLRKLFGREYFILKRRLNWIFAKGNFARPLGGTQLQYRAIKHHSVLLRPLKDVDMYLQHNKITNLRLAIDRINGVVIEPGQTFSIWKLVGRPTRAKGYLEGLVLMNGKISTGIGGGLCQLGNLVYWMALHTPLTITERWRHGFDVFPDVNRTIPFACGATLSYNYVDLQIKNETTERYQIVLWLDEEYLHGEIKAEYEPEYEYEVFESDHLIKPQFWGGYTRHNRIWKRRKCKTGGSTEDQLVTDNHAIMMYNPLLGE